MTAIEHHRPPEAAAPPQPDRPPVPPIVGPMRTALTAVGLAVAALGSLGFVNSFHRVDQTAQPSFHGLAWTVPIGIDLAIGIFSALDIVLAKLEMRIGWLRLIPWALTAVTIQLNIADQAGQPPLSGFDKLAHGVLPALWALSVEVGAHVVRKRAQLTSEKRMDRVRASRWLLAPVTTMGLWRRMVLWEERSYPAALERERDRVLARTDMQDAYGRLWRWRAPRRARALYRLGALTPTAVAAVPVSPAENTGPGAGHGPGNAAENTAAHTARNTARVLPENTARGASKNTGSTGAENTQAVPENTDAQALPENTDAEENGGLFSGRDLSEAELAGLIRQAHPASPPPVRQVMRDFNVGYSKASKALSLAVAGRPVTAANGSAA